MSVRCYEITKSFVLKTYGSYDKDNNTVKLNTDVKVTFNSKSKVREINTVTESATSQAHKLYCIDFFVIRLR